MRHGTESCHGRQRRAGLGTRERHVFGGGGPQAGGCRHKLRAPAPPPRLRPFADWQLRDLQCGVVQLIDDAANLV